MAEEKTYVFGNDSQGLWSALPAMLSSRGVDPSILAAFGNSIIYRAATLS